MEKLWDISICGLNCAVCDFKKAAEGDKKKQQEIIDWVKRDFGKDITTEQAQCTGCRGPLDTHWSSTCKMLTCAKEKGHTYCFECPEFVCEKLDAFANDGPKNHKKTVENMKKMKEIGLEAWIAKQSKKDAPSFCP